MLYFSQRIIKTLKKYRRFWMFRKYYAWHKYLYFPAFMTSEDLREYGKIFERFSTAFIRKELYALEFCRERGIALFAGTGFEYFQRDERARFAAGRSVEHFVLFQRNVFFRNEAIRAVRMPSCFAGGLGKGHGAVLLSVREKLRRLRPPKPAILLKDEDGREFPLLRGENSGCRFELFNNVPLVAKRRGGMLYDFRALTEEEKEAYLNGAGRCRVKGPHGGRGEEGYSCKRGACVPVLRKMFYCSILMQRKNLS